MEKFEEHARQAQEYKELWTERTAVQEQLDTVLGDETDSNAVDLDFNQK